ncbi:MAG: hypothetical protein SFY70_06155 [Bacteroidia bacterium]|nr:hypothetical protein [Bacteroidia bacterium]
MQTLPERQPWLGAPWAERLGILLPPFLVCALVAVLPTEVRGGSLPPWVWLLVVVGIDVSHVYATLFRTYLHPTARARLNWLLWLVPALGLVVSVGLYVVNPLVFWRSLAYLAVFHFVRQQYGFLRLYSRHERQRPVWSRRLDALAIYGATLYPMAYWHLSSQRSFVWFLEGDFWALTYPQALPYAQGVWLALLVGYCAKEWVYSRREGRVNWPKQAILAGTALSWYLGIVVWNSDLAFTLTNVVSHGVPYFTLVWLRNRQADGARVRRLGWRASLVGIVGLCMLLAVVEEVLWDRWVWADHAHLFPFSGYLPTVSDSAWFLLVPLLALPQLTHYLLDGFIWRRNAPAP